jgi:hypothetical protein
MAGLDPAIHDLKGGREPPFCIQHNPSRSLLVAVGHLRIIFKP